MRTWLVSFFPTLPLHRSSFLYQDYRTTSCGRDRMLPGMGSDFASRMARSARPRFCLYRAGRGSQITSTDPHPYPSSIQSVTNDPPVSTMKSSTSVSMVQSSTFPANRSPFIHSLTNLRMDSSLTPRPDSRSRMACARSPIQIEIPESSLYQGPIGAQIHRGSEAPSRSDQPQIVRSAAGTEHHDRQRRTTCSALARRRQGKPARQRWLDLGHRA